MRAASPGPAEQHEVARRPGRPGADTRHAASRPRCDMSALRAAPFRGTRAPQTRDPGQEPTDARTSPVMPVHAPAQAPQLAAPTHIDHPPGGVPPSPSRKDHFLREARSIHAREECLGAIRVREVVIQCRLCARTRLDLSAPIRARRRRDGPASEDLAERSSRRRRLSPQATRRRHAHHRGIHERSDGAG